MKRWRCYLYMLIHQAMWAGWVLLVLIAVVTTAGFLTSPWVGIAALGLDAFLIVMGMSFVIFAYGFNSITGINMTEHRLRCSDEGLAVVLDEGKEIGIEKGDIDPYHVFPGGVVVPVGGPRSGWLWVPPKAFETDEEFQEFLKRLYTNEGNTK